MKYSVLMAVYIKENPSWFKKSIESILAQSVPTDDFVIVCDGPLTDELNAVIEEAMLKAPNIFNIIRLATNLGLANALKVGLEVCKNECIMRMDSDDYSYPNRAELQINLIEQGHDIVGSSVSEFDGDDCENGIIGYKYMPISHNKIIKFAKRRSPFNHPTVMYKKSMVEKAGGYLDSHFSEDYYLWIRLIQNGAKCANTSEILVAMKSGLAMRKRRGGHSLRKARVALRKYMLRTKFINLFQFIFYLSGELFVTFLPLKMREYIYRKFLRTMHKK